MLLANMLTQKNGPLLRILKKKNWQRENISRHSRDAAIMASHNTISDDGLHLRDEI